jgi:hypothetical protein
VSITSRWSRSPVNFEENRLFYGNEERNSTFWALYGGAMGRMRAGKLTFDGNGNGRGTLGGPGALL